VLLEFKRERKDLMLKRECFLNVKGTMWNFTRERDNSVREGAVSISKRFVSIREKGDFMSRKVNFMQKEPR
jgi:hypothetical protein